MQGLGSRDRFCRDRDMDAQPELLNDPRLADLLPDWIDEVAPPAADADPRDELRMDYVLRLAELNVERRTGGPFSAAVFRPDGSLAAAAVNVVVPTGCYLLHAEVLALAIAQRALGEPGTVGKQAGGCELFSSAEPCAMCYGAIALSGITRLVCGARSEDVEAVGFDEGPKPDDWTDILAARGIAVGCDIRRQQAADILTRYRDIGSPIYQ